MRRLPDGSYLSRIYPSERDWRHKTSGVSVRVIDYRLEGVANAEPIYRLVTTLLEFVRAPAPELMALHHERWEIGTALDELKTHLRGANIVLRRKTPDLVRQEFYGLIMARFATRNLTRNLIHEAALWRLLFPQDDAPGPPFRFNAGGERLLLSCKVVTSLPLSGEKADRAFDWAVLGVVEAGAF